MGLVVDTSILVAHERSRRSVAQLMEDLDLVHPAQSIAISTMTIVELTHGVYRSRDPHIARRRQSFIDKLIEGIEIIELTVSLARLIGPLEAQQAIAGRIVDLPDLIIAASAMQRDDAILTLNAKHFALIPNLRVLTPS